VKSVLNAGKNYLLLLFATAALVAGGCGRLDGLGGDAQTVWSRHGISAGRFSTPRAMAISDSGEIFVVDKTARIQVFSDEGEYLRGWRTPEFKKGKPTGLSFDLDGNLLVADTHYARILTYSPAGKLLEEKTIGGVLGYEPGQFGLVTDAVQDSQGNYYVSEYGEFDRIQKFSPEGQFLFQWGGHGSELGQFLRPQNLQLDEHDHLWVVDACNHRVQVFDATGDKPIPIKSWGTEGSEPGQLSYPYDLVLDGKGHVYISEFGNHRVQKFTLEGESVGCWGAPGRQPGQLFQPWALAIDHGGHVIVLDTKNHRLQQFVL